MTVSLSYCELVRHVPSLVLLKKWVIIVDYLMYEGDSSKTRVILHTD